MTREIVVNAGPLIHLAGIGRFYLLQSLFDFVDVPDAVYEEVVTHGEGQTGAPEVATALERGWMRRRTVANRVAVTLLDRLCGEKVKMRPQYPLSKMFPDTELPEL